MFLLVYWLFCLFKCAVGSLFWAFQLIWLLCFDFNISLWLLLTIFHLCLYTILFTNSFPDVSYALFFSSLNIFNTVILNSFWNKCNIYASSGIVSTNLFSSLKKKGHGFPSLCMFIHFFFLAKKWTLKRKRSRLLDWLCAWEVLR